MRYIAPTLIISVHSKRYQMALSPFNTKKAGANRLNLFNLPGDFMLASKKKHIFKNTAARFP